MNVPDHFPGLTRRAFLGGCVFSLGASLGCTTDGHMDLLGYSTKPNYDANIRTVYVPIFKNQVFQTTPFRELEKQLTRTVIARIEDRTPFKVISDPDRADTELLGTVVTLNKVILNVSQVNLVRQFDLMLTVEIVWRDLRTGKVLSNRSPALPAQVHVDPFDPRDSAPIDPLDPPIPVRLISTGRGIPEVGESTTTALKMAIDRMAILIVNLMEEPW